MSAHRARALVLARAPLRESDLRATLLTEHGARLLLTAHGAQRSSRRFPGALAPLTLYDAAWSESRRALRLDEAQVLRAWPALLGDLKLNSAAMLGTCVCNSLGDGVPGDGGQFLLLFELFESLAAAPSSHAVSHLLRYTFDALAHAGTAIALDRCVRCDAPAPDAALVTVEPREGGIVCRGCGGGAYRLGALDRRALRALGVPGELPAGLVEVTASIIVGVAEEAATHLRRGAPLFQR